MVAYLTKSDASEGFNQIIDFLNGSSIKYALIVNDIIRLQALVDKKKVVVTEDTIREALHLDDAKGVECLPNEEIFCMSAKRTSWNEFSSSMAFDVICLSSGDLSTHSTKYTSPALTQKVFANMRRVGKGFSGVETPLFEGKLVEQQVVEEGDADGNDETVNAAKGDVREDVAEIDQDIDVVLEDDREVADTVKDVKEDETKPAEVQDVVDVVTTAKIIIEVVTAASETITAASTHITAAPNKGRGILVEEPKPLKKKQKIKQDEQYARELHAELNKNIELDEVIDHVKIKAKEDPAVKKYQALKRKPQPEAKFNSNMAFLITTKEQIEEDENRALQRLNETLAERAAKRRKLNEEEEGLKRHLQILPNEDDDVYTKAIPLARKVPIVDYQIIELNNKPYYKIIRANDIHQLYPKNVSDDFLLVTLEAMFEKPNFHAQIWKNQRSVHGPVKVKGWKLLESCGVQIINFTTTQLILLVERKYPLTRFTLDQILNAVRLEVEEESEVSLELLRFIRQQHQEGQLE
nr:hypothetical protein [Tanacetum cinerariifolium]